MIHGFDVCIGTLLWFQSRPDSKIRSPLWLRWVRRSDLGWPLLPPSFLSSSPANHRAGGDGPSRRQAQGVVRPAAQRGHGPARLDCTRARATVADKVMESGKTAGHGNGRLCVPNRTASGARRPGSGSRAGGVNRAERGNDGSPKGARRQDRRAGRLDAQHDSAPGRLLGRGRPDLNRHWGT